MQPPIRKATFIVRLWTDGDPVDDNTWRGTAEHIGSGQSRQFQTLDELFDWLRHELAKTEGKPAPASGSASGGGAPGAGR